MIKLFELYLVFLFSTTNTSCDQTINTCAEPGKNTSYDNITFGIFFLFNGDYVSFEDHAFCYQDQKKKIFLLVLF